MIFRVPRRLWKGLRTHGVVGTIKMVMAYTRWRLQGAPTASDAPSLDDWTAAYQTLRPYTTDRVTFTVVCPVHNTPPRMLSECVESVRSQTWADWELILVDDCSTDPETLETLAHVATLDTRIRLQPLGDNAGIAVASNAGADVSTGEFLVFLDHDDLLAPTALEWLSSCVSDADLIYTDEDKIDEHGGKRHPFFKPAWSPRLLLGVNYVNHITCLRRSTFEEAGGFRPGTDGVQDHDLLLRLSETPIRVAHIPNILYHWRAWSGSAAGRPAGKRHVEEKGIRVISDAIERRGWNARAGLGSGSPFNYRVFWNAEPDPPLVKVVIPTRDRVRMLRKAVSGVLERTDGVRTQLVIVDNGSRKDTTLAYLAELDRRDDVTIHRVDDAFNFSRLCNEGVEVGPPAPLVLFLNNDIEVLHRNWLLQLSGWLNDPGVVGVGPKLLFPDRTIQHAGVILGFGGIAGHYAGYQPDEPLLGNLHDQIREVSCLTAACLLLRSDDYYKVGGMNENLALDFQDVDLCLRLSQELEGDLVYDPTYPLIHRQSATRGATGSASGYTTSRIEFLWGDAIDRGDAHYSPHMSLSAYDFRLAPIPTSAEARRERLSPRLSPPAQTQPYN